jgi:geranylgeranyl diphosphate synthase type I
MDRDTMRRGEPTLFRQYQLWSRKQGSSDSDHLGESLGICAGDILIFLCFNLLSSLPAKTLKINQQLLHLFALELSKVGLAQMQDVFSGSTKKPVSLADIQRLYRYKTARYTFSLPLMLGSIASGQNPKSISTLEKIGELLGYVFQLRDDELGIMGEQKKIGKPVGSDIRENKKTLYHFYLFQKVTASERKKLSGIFGNPKITKQDITYIHSLLTKYSIHTLLHKEQLSVMKQINKLVAALSLRSLQKLFLEKLILYNTKRST